MVNTKKKIIIVGGKVHYVGYRPFLLRKARELRIPNFDAKNITENKTQKIIVSVGGEEKQVHEFLEFARKESPLEAKVLKVEEAEHPEYLLSIDEYDKILSAEQQNTIVQTGLGMIGLQKQTLGLQKETLRKQDQMLEKQDQTINIIKKGNEKLCNKIDEGNEKLSGKQDQTIEILTETKNQTIQRFDKLDNTLDKRFNSLDNSFHSFHNDTLQRFDSVDLKYGKISENMERILEELKEEKEKSRESMERMINAILKLAEKK